MIKILFNYGLPGSGKTMVSHRDEELLQERGFTPHFMDDKMPLDKAVWADVSRFLGDPTRRTKEGGIRGEHSIVHNPEAPVGRLQISFLDGTGLNFGHDGYFDTLQEFIKYSGPNDVVVAEITPGQNDYSFGPGKVPVIHSPEWNRKQLQSRGLLEYGLIKEIKAKDNVRDTRNIERTTYTIPQKIMDAEFRNVGGTFSIWDKLIFGNRYTSLENNGNDARAFLQKVDERFINFISYRLAEGRMGAHEGNRRYIYKEKR